MANLARGEVELVCGEKRLVLCLTLGALAEIEAALGGEVSGAMSRVKASDLAAILRALLKGGGEVEAARDVAALPLNPGDVARAIAAAFAAAA
jgi:hypothetical protein